VTSTLAALVVRRFGFQWTARPLLSVHPADKAILALQWAAPAIHFNWATNDPNILLEHEIRWPNNARVLAIQIDSSVAPAFVWARFSRIVRAAIQTARSGAGAPKAEEFPSIVPNPSGRDNLASSKLAHRFYWSALKICPPADIQ